MLRYTLSIELRLPLALKENLDIPNLRIFYESSQDHLIPKMISTTHTMIINVLFIRKLTFCSISEISDFFFFF